MKEDRCYSLPLQKGTRKLTLDTLNNHSEFRFTKRPYLLIRMKSVSFKNEVWTLSIILDHEKEEFVYIRVLQIELKISCSVDTDQTYLSRYSYFAMYNLTYVSGYFDFTKYYWPDFFDMKTGRSKYLDIIIDRAGTEIKVKPKYSSFYKPGQKLIFPFKDLNTELPLKETTQNETINQMNWFAIGYCLADTGMISNHSCHLPFLVCYSGIWKESWQEIKGFDQFILNNKDELVFDFTPIQCELNALSREMIAIAPVKSPPHKSALNEQDAVRRENVRGMQQMYDLWRKAVPLLHSQQFTHFLYTYGMRNVKGKPTKKYMIPCKFSTLVPKLCFLFINKGEYFQLEMRLKVEGKSHMPHISNPTFFIHSANEPNKLYLLDSITDYQVSRFFAKNEYRLSILKCHYQTHFKPFINRLAAIYEVKFKGINKF